MASVFSQRLNIGCGSQFDPRWTNLDLVSTDDRVIQADITAGLPFDSEAFDFVYHSHVLEHLTPDQAVQLVQECWRVLRPGGVLRIVVPDLETICRLYLENLDAAWQGEGGAVERYQWMKLELLDQMVRRQSGGCMGPFLAELPADTDLAKFIATRFGKEVATAKQAGDAPQDQSPCPTAKNQSRGTWWNRTLSRIKASLLKRLLTANQLRHLADAEFRGQGEIHQWMYDRQSLRELCQQAGFRQFELRSAEESFDSQFATFNLDAMESAVRKPDSIFCECRKPGTSAAMPDPGLGSAVPQPAESELRASSAA